MIGSRRKRYRAAVDAARSGTNPNEAVVGNYSRLDRLAIWMTGSIGTMKFTLALLTVTLLWIGYNIAAPFIGMPQVDKLPALVIYLLGVNIFGTVLMPLLMVGQNMQSRQQEAKAEQDFQNNKKALAILEQIMRDINNDGR